MKNKAIKNKGIISQEIIDQIIRGIKIKTNLKLIEDKFDESNNNYNMIHNSTAIHQTEIEKESNNTINKFTDKLKNHNSIDLNQLEFSQNKLIKQLDLILFNNIDTSRNIYTKIAKFYDLLNMNIHKREKCEFEMKKVIGENLELKEALAEIEMKMRLSNSSKK